MPIHDETEEFWRDWQRLTPAQRAQFLSAVPAFVHDLSTGRFRKSLGVKGFRSITGVFEMRWAPDGRALWMYGSSSRHGNEHVIWLRIGSHDIFRDT